jgi:hypothetical protein
MDIEFTGFGSPGPPNARFSVRPSSGSFSIGENYTVPPGAGITSHTINWTTTRVEFSSVVGDATSMGKGLPAIHTFSYTGPEVPTPGPESIRVNYYLFDGAVPPISPTESEIIIDSFTFEPDPSTLPLSRTASIIIVLLVVVLATFKLGHQTPTPFD